MKDHSLKDYPYAPVDVNTDRDQRIKPVGPKMPRQEYADDSGDGGYKPSGPNRKGD